MTTFIFTDDADVIDGSAAPGNNIWHMLKGEDFLFTGIGDDLIYGGWGDDFLDGNRGSDEIHGGDGHDLIVGGRQQDKLFGDNGHDWLEDNGDNQPDRMVGGAGDDRFISDGGRISGGSGSDLTIADMEAGHVFVFHLLDFQAEDELQMSSTTPEHFLDNAQILALLDRNGDHWLGLKDAGPAEDGFSVTVANGNLDLEVDGHHVILHDMVKANFDFLT